MSKPNYESQIKRKIKQFEKQKEQIQKHLLKLEKELSQLNQEHQNILSLLDETNHNIDTLKASIDIMTIGKHHIQQYSSGHYSYVTNLRVFNSKVNKLVILILKQNPQTQYRVKELAVEVLKSDGKDDVIANILHFKAVRRTLDKFAKKGLVHKIKVSHKHVLWQWKSR